MEKLIYNSSHESANELIEFINRMESDEYADASPLDFFKDELFYKPFCVRLLDFYNNVFGTDLTAHEAKEAILKNFSEKGISIAYNTVTNWLSADHAPKYGADGRAMMYKLAFALELDAPETVKLFNEVYLDKTCNYRSVREYVYMYCICRKKTYQEAEAVIAEVFGRGWPEGYGGSEHDSAYLRQRATETETDDEIVDYILNHRSAFSVSDVKALAVLDKLLGIKDGAAKSGDSPIGGKNGLVMQELKARIANGEPIREAFRKKLRPETEGFLITAIIFGNGSGKVEKCYEQQNKSMKKRIKYQLKERIKNKLPREVVVNFPGKDNFGHKDEYNSNSLRKKIILLYFYQKWTCIYYKHSRNITEDDCRNFYSELNATLDDCGYSKLYSRNPYDRLFIYCTEAANRTQANPVVILRDLFDEEDADD